jgi:hypothetical protein
VGTGDPVLSGDNSSLPSSSCAVEYVDVDERREVLDTADVVDETGDSQGPVRGVRSLSLGDI